jgi:hypothetical protein
MADLMDYLTWRGDLTMEQAPFNEVDGLALSMITYVDFAGVVPTESEGGGIPLCEAVKAYFARNANKKDSSATGGDKGKGTSNVKVLQLGVLLPTEIHKLLLKMAAVPRFRDMVMCRHTCELQETGEKVMQFSALTFRWSMGKTDGVFVAFRGTDDTLAGCREDLNLSFMDEIPSQRRATAYLDGADLRKTFLFLNLNRKVDLYVGGHSKGGNLAVWSAVHASEAVRKKIRRIYNYDGPGFSASLLQSEGYRSLDGRVITLVPQDSLVGLLLENDGKYQIIKSSQKGLYQHNGLGWMVEGTAFVRTQTLSKGGIKTDTVTRSRIASMTAEERRTLTNLIFEVVESTGARTLSELSEAKLKNAMTMLKTINEYDKATRALLIELLIKLFVSRKALKPKNDGE